ncbi:MAG TPA: radical SAM protein [Rectinemataceae bacterium]|nr:radical SAM protein [Rectinemataceae bacterium]
MRALLIQSPFVQLNAPYPAVHYLGAWLRSRGHEVEVEDHSIELYRLLFSREGLSSLFDEIGSRRELGRIPEGSEDEVDRYLSYRGLYEAWIGPVVAWLSGADPAFAHRLSAAAEFPRGARVESLLESRGGRPGPEDASLLASLILEDLGDLLSQVVDQDFGTIQYGERLGRSRDDFGEVASSLDSSWIMKELYRPWLRERFLGRLEEGRTGLPRPDLVLLSIPFPGSLVGALVAASEARAAFGPAATIVLGGGYVSTELRGLRDPAIFNFCDFLCFDAGYGALASIIVGLEEGGRAEGLPASSLYRTMALRGGRIVAAGFPEGDLAATEWGCAGEAAAFHPRVVVAADARTAAKAKELDALALRVAHPDYRGLDPSRYLRPLDSTNPMHRLWSESPWLKYRLAQGCYWKRCSFCDTELDYVREYRGADLAPLVAAMAAASAGTGLYGIHFVDEALPVARLLAFAEENRRRAAGGLSPWHFWGNVRFDASWTPERIELLAASGLVAVSGGIEVATEGGLAMTDKGFDLAGLVRCLVAFRRAGVLVHSYLIYGFPGQDEADIVESADFVRGLFAAGLVDSAFWHRFVLTRHSRMYAEWRAGIRPGLHPIDRGGAFAANDLEFEGEGDYDAYGEALDAALGAWMEGEELDRPAREWPGLGSKKRKGEGSEKRGGGNSQAGTGPDGVSRVEALIAAAEKEIDSRALPSEGRVYWIAGLPLAAQAPGKGGEATALRWAFRGELENLKVGDMDQVQRAIGELAAHPEGLDFQYFVEGSGLDPKTLSRLRDAGLIILAGTGSR